MMMMMMLRKAEKLKACYWTLADGDNFNDLVVLFSSFFLGISSIIFCNSSGMSSR